MNTLVCSYIIPAIRAYARLHLLNNTHVEHTQKLKSVHQIVDALELNWAKGALFLTDENVYRTAMELPVLADFVF